MAALGAKAKTGEKCPESGVWRSAVVDNQSTTAPIAKGNIMPPYRNKAIFWTLIQHA